MITEEAPTFKKNAVVKDAEWKKLQSIVNEAIFVSKPRHVKIAWIKTNAWMYKELITVIGRVHAIANFSRKRWIRKGLKAG